MGKDFIERRSETVYLVCGRTITALKKNGYTVGGQFWDRIEGRGWGGGGPLCSIIPLTPEGGRGRRKVRSG